MTFFRWQSRHRFLCVHQRQCQWFGRTERQFADQQFVSEHTDAVQIGAAIHDLAPRLFRRHVTRAADRKSGGGDAGGVALGQRDAEVGQQRPIGAVEQHVLFLDVAMHDAACMCVFEPGQQRTQHLDDARFVLGEIALRQIPIGQVRHDVVHLPVIGAADLVDADDARMGDLGDRARLVFEALLADLVLQRLQLHHLDADRTIERFLHRQIHRRHATLAKTAQEAIAGKAWIFARMHQTLGAGGGGCRRAGGFLHHRYAGHAPDGEHPAYGRRCLPGSRINIDQADWSGLRPMRAGMSQNSSEDILRR